MTPADPNFRRPDSPIFRGKSTLLAIRRQLLLIWQAGTVPY